MGRFLGRDNDLLLRGGALEGHRLEEGAPLPIKVKKQTLLPPDEFDDSQRGAVVETQPLVLQDRISVDVLDGLV